MSSNYKREKYWFKLNQLSQDIKQVLNFDNTNNNYKKLYLYLKLHSGGSIKTAQLVKKFNDELGEFQETDEKIILGKGNFGIVYKYMINGKKYVIKQFNQINNDKIDHEIKVGQNLFHPNIIRIFGSFNPQNNQPKIIVAKEYDGVTIHELLTYYVYKQKQIGGALFNADEDTNKNTYVEDIDDEDTNKDTDEDTDVEDIDVEDIDVQDIDEEIIKKINGFSEETKSKLTNLLEVLTYTNKLKNIMKKMISAVKYLHIKNMIHNDISVRNFMLTFDEEPEPILIDLGLVTYLEDNKICNCNTIQGVFIKKQQNLIDNKLKQSGQNLKNDEIIDIYKTKDIICLGLVFYILILKVTDITESSIQKEFDQYLYNLYKKRQKLTDDEQELLSIIGININNNKLHLSYMFAEDIQQQQKALDSVMSRLGVGQTKRSNIELVSEQHQIDTLLQKIKEPENLLFNNLYKIFKEEKEAESKHIIEKFRNYDNNNDGLISYDEFKEIFSSQNANDDRILDLFRYYSNLLESLNCKIYQINIIEFKYFLQQISLISNKKKSVKIIT